MPPNLIQALAALRMARMRQPQEYGKMAMRGLELGQMGGLREAQAAAQRAAAGRSVALGGQAEAAREAMMQRTSARGGIEGPTGPFVRAEVPLGAGPTAAAISGDKPVTVPLGEGVPPLVLPPEVQRMQGVAQQAVAGATTLPAKQAEIMRKAVEAAVGAGVSPNKPDGAPWTLDELRVETAKAEKEERDFQRTTGKARVEALEARSAALAERLTLLGERVGIQKKTEQRRILGDIAKMALDVQGTEGLKDMAPEDASKLLSPLNLVVRAAYTDPELAAILTAEGISIEGYNVEDVSRFRGFFGRTPVVGPAGAVGPPPSVTPPPGVTDVRGEKIKRIEGTTESLEEELRKLEAELGQ